jgi:hypothetical protein
MAAILVALYDNYSTAERVRTELVHDGFPTDRVELTSRPEPGTAGTLAAGSSEERFRKYFETLFDEERHRGCADYLAGRVATGAAVVTVHPRGDEEIGRASQILERNGPLELDREHLDQTVLEHAASAHGRTLIARLLEPDRRP